jgi:hypothetical protein
MTAFRNIQFSNPYLALPPRIPFRPAFLTRYEVFSGLDTFRGIVASYPPGTLLGLWFSTNPHQIPCSGGEKKKKKKKKL